MSITSTGLSKHERQGSIRSKEPPPPAEPPAPPTLRYLDPKQAAALLHLSVQHLAKLRHTGTGPPYIKPAAKVLYRQDWLIEWAEALVFRSTTDEAVKRNMPPTKRGRPRGRPRKDAAQLAPEPDPQARTLPAEAT
jgi:hypothetical protein